ncbi:molybdopterin-guanine dinucleotide biosynthesis protein A [Verrucomicrobium sp. GAS474]|uniref:molybdenum cofactor guanylyltransferase n=1 Tax=Verrucomicrobium sp. GAS474 TaxID=1882831 RepID=UPI00087C48D4|nr:molybdenum cofactor guanylyltransferase [Verrucomicrobium sp. GAS474]SDT95496.1 molybdopterin-guanine dinucleotide biosynthesis protein A [Verrucomicrobium sp. GAS474]
MSETPGPSFAYAAALFVGGRSTRMGEDKAGLAWRGRTFLDLQLGTLRSLDPAPARLFLSTRERGEPPAPDVEVVPDLPSHLDRGPLGGLLAALTRAEAAGLPFLLALAIDMPRMTAAWLRPLLLQAQAQAQAQTQQGPGVIPELAGGRLEPLAALWPVALLPEIGEQLAGHDAALHRLARRGIETGKLVPLPVRAEDEGLFLNVNRKSDWESLENLEGRSIVG